MTGFGRTLWRYMQDYADKEMGREMTRTDLSVMLTAAGFDVDPGNVGQWMNGDRRPPAGLPYYSAMVLDLDEEERCELAWAYLEQYKDHMKGRGSSKDKEVSSAKTPSPEELLTEENRRRIEAKKREWEDRDEGKRGERGSPDTGDRRM